MPSSYIAVIGGGPAGLMAAETLARAGAQVQVYDAMPSVGRKFLLAGRGGLNLTHSEPADRFVSRYRERSNEVGNWLRQFNSDDLRAWTHELGVETFVGSSGRVFPSEMKAAPMLRKWLHRLRAQGVQVHTRHVWKGWSENGDVLFDTPQGPIESRPDAVILALGGASWPRLGSDGAWQGPLAARRVRITPLRPANCGFLAGWSPLFQERHAGQPLKSIAMAPRGETPMRRGECMVTSDGLEGGLVYAWSALLREALEREGEAWLCMDLLPDRDPDQVLAEISRPRGSRSWSSHLASRLGLQGAKAGLLRECLDKSAYGRPDVLARAIKCLPLRLTGTRPLDEAISTAGGVAFDSLDADLMLRDVPGVFCAGEMLDWEAPTGGYLLTACFASGHAAAQGALRWLEASRGVGPHAGPDPKP